MLVVSISLCFSLIEMVYSLSNKEFSALRDLFDATSGPEWVWESSAGSGPVWNFNSPEGAEQQQDPCADDSLGYPPAPWQGIICSSSPSDCYASKTNCSVTKIILDAHNLKGSIPVSIGDLNKLEEFDANRNSLIGSLPSALGKLEQLMRLSLDFNVIAGYLPPGLFNMSSLVYLSLWKNCLQGSIPVELGNRKVLEYIDLEQNRLIGSLPHTLSKLLALQILYLGVNQLTGSIPENLDILSALEGLSLSVNKFRGTIPENLSKLSNLHDLSLDVNFLTGTIPESLSKLSALRGLYIAVNQFQGEIPESLSKLSNLQVLNLGVNHLTGTIPASLSNLTALRYLSLQDNQFTGTIPASLHELGLLQVLYLDQNYLTRNVPKSLYNLISLQRLTLGNNQLSGTISGSIGELSILQRLYMDVNHLTGTLPTTVDKLKTIQHLYLSDNHFSGTLPPSLNRLINLTRVSLYNNQFTSSLPAGIMSSKYLEIIQVQNNKLTGPISDVFQLIEKNASVLHTIDISGNSFHGKLSGSVFMLQNLTNFAATGNCFSGELSNEICGSHSIEVLALTGLSSGSRCPRYISRIRGTIPSCITSLKSLKALYLSGNGLYGTLGDLANISKLVNLSASNNHINGVLPLKYSTIHNLELSYNRITGTVKNLSSSTGENNIYMSLGLKVNRLSGHISELVFRFSSLDILSGNLFGCSSRDKLPSNDPERDRADCGSNMLNQVIILCGCLVGIIGIILLRSYLYKSRSKMNSNQIDLFSKNLQLSLNGLFFKKDLKIDERFSIVNRTLSTITRLVSIVCDTGILVSIFSSIIFVSLKIVGDHGTHSHQYSWIVTAAMVSGETSAVCLCLFWSAIAAIVYWRLIILQNSVDRMAVEMNLKSDHSIKFLYNELFNIQLSTKVHVVLIIIINVIITAVVNGVYVYLVFEQSSYFVVVLVQALLGSFRLAWKIVLPKVLSWSHFNDISVGFRVRLMLLASILDDIVVPVVAFMCVDPSCFLAYFSRSNPETVTYSYDSCALFYTETGVCVDGYTVTNNYESRYQPLFIYNYQCGTSVIKAFVPVIMFSYCVSCLLSLFFIFLANTTFKWEDWTSSDSIILLILPELLVPHHVSHQNTITERNILEGDIFLVVVYQHLAILLSFGICAPYVALMCIASSIMITVRIISSITRFISNQIAVNNNDDNSESMRQLNENCRTVAADKYYDWCLLMTFVCGGMVSLLQIDMAADEGQKSYSVKYFIFFLPPLMITILGELFRRQFHQPILIDDILNKDLDENSHIIQENIEMNPLHSPVLFNSMDNKA